MTYKISKSELNEMATECVAVEFYSANPRYYRLHTDSLDDSDIVVISDLPDEVEVLDAVVMDEEEYGNTVLINSCVYADFGGWYGDKEAKVLVVVLPED